MTLAPEDDMFAVSKFPCVQPRSAYTVATVESRVDALWVGR
jgi:hypothetical protein